MNSFDKFRSFFTQAEWDDICAHFAARFDAENPAPSPEIPALLECHRRECERAIEAAAHPKGMSVHDGKARIDASILQRLLLIAETRQQPPQPPGGE